MFWVDLFFAFLVAAVLSVVLVGLTGWRRPRREEEGMWPSLIALFVVLVLMVWAGGVWVTPFGPPVWGGYWAPFLLVGVMVALLIATLTTAARPPRARREPRVEGEIEAEEAAASFFGLFFWLLLVIGIAALVIRYA